MKRLTNSLALCLFVSNLTSVCKAVDADEDSLDDALEDFLIDRHRPWLTYDSRNDTWPISVGAYVRESDLRSASGIAVARTQMRFNPLLALSGRSPDGTGSDDVFYAGSSTFKLDPNGLNFGAGPGPAGTYAHVMRLVAPMTYLQRECCPVGSSGDILIQYWQFFAYNDSQAPSCCTPLCPGLCDWGDHEGDWLYLDVVVDGSTLALKNIVYHHHGDSNCAVSILPGDTGECTHAISLPNDGVPQCYLEEGSHEWWPLPCNQDCSPGGHRDPCDGAGVSYRTENVVNVGERFRPMPSLEAQLVVLINAKWGTYAGDQFADPADSPLQQSSPGFVQAPFWTVHAAPNGYVHIGGVSDGLGSPRGPLARIEDAASRIHPGGTILAQPGTYSGPGNRGITISTPCSIIAPAGPVTIGQ